MTNCVPAIFLDRDGTINVDHGYVYEINRFQFIDGVIDACHELKEMGFILVVVTNQSGIARGKFSEKQFIHLTTWMDLLLANHNVICDGVYFCPHHPEALIAKYRKSCDCRKPKPGMLFQALHKLNINMATSYMVGDTYKDMQAAVSAGVGTKVLVHTGKPVTKQSKKLADWILNSLAELPEAIRQRI